MMAYSHHHPSRCCRPVHRPPLLRTPNAEGRRRHECEKDDEEYYAVLTVDGHVGSDPR